MPYFSTSQDWLIQSTLLLQARPTTSRVTTKYTASPSVKSHRQQKRLKKARTDIGGPSITTGTPSGSLPSQTAPTGNLTLKTYDPVSGVCLKYRTHKAAEVGRLVSALGRLGKGMAGQPMDERVGLAAADVDPAGSKSAKATEDKPKQLQTPGQASTGGSVGGGGKKKKKGKK